MALDLPSYLLGKSKGGGGGSTLITKNITENGTYNASDDSADGYSKVNVNVSADVSDYFTDTISAGTGTSNTGLLNMIKNIPASTTVNGTSLKYAFANFKGATISLFDTSNVTDMSYSFNSCSNLTLVPLFDTSNVTNFEGMFWNSASLSTIPNFNTSKAENLNRFIQGCINVETFPSIDTSNVTSMALMCFGCLNLKNVPLLNASKVTNFNNPFQNCPNLTDTSLDNILQMCISAISYTGTKTFTQLGFKVSDYSVSRIEALPHYQDFIDAGWALGF